MPNDRPRRDVEDPAGEPDSSLLVEDEASEESLDTDATGERETEDGLDPLAEAARQAAEDAPSPDEDTIPDRIPVFDRGELPPKL